MSGNALKHEKTQETGEEENVRKNDEIVRNKRTTRYVRECVKTRKTQETKEKEKVRKND